MVPRKNKILVMDDDEMIRDLTTELLESMGLDASFAKDGSEAIAMYEKARQFGRPFEAVIMDLTIPGGMGGKEAIEKLRSLDPEVKAIVSSGYSNDPIMADHEKYGFVGVSAQTLSSRRRGQDSEKDFAGHGNHDLGSRHAGQSPARSPVIAGRSIRLNEDSLLATDEREAWCENG